MAGTDSTIRLPDDTPNTGKQVDCDTLPVGGSSVYRERIRLAGAAAAQLADILNATPAGTEYGLVTRPIIAPLPAALDASGGFKVAIVGDSVGSVAENSGDNTAVVSLNSKVLAVGGVAVTPKFAKIVASTTGATAVVSAVATKKIRVLSYVVVANGAVNVKFQSAVVPTDLTGLLYLGVNGGVSAAFSHVGHFETVAGEALNINLSGNVAVGGHLVYAEI